MDLKNQKDFLRKKYLQLRQNFFNQFSFEQEKQLISNIFSLEEFKKAKVVLSYMSKDSEVPTRNLNLEILKSQKVLCLPKTDIKNKNLIIKKINSFSDLELGAFGVLEPKENSENIINLDIAILPGILFAKNGNRLGYGLGFYDRFLKNKNFFKIGLCFSFQVVENLPSEEHDIKMDCIISENFILRIKK